MLRNLSCGGLMIVIGELSLLLFVCSVQLLSCVRLCDPMNRSTPGLPVHHQLPEFTQTHVHRVSDALQPSHPLCPFLFLPSIFPGIGSFPMSQLFISGGQSIGASASVLPRNIQLDFLEDWLVWSPCCPWDSQESSPTPQFKSINSSVLSLLYGPPLTSIHDYWKNHSFDYTELCLQSDVSAF